MKLFGKVLSILSGLFLVYCLIDFLTAIFTGQTIGNIIEGESGPVVSWVIESIPAVSPLAFILLNMLAVLILSFLISLCFWIAVRPDRVVA